MSISKYFQRFFEAFSEYIPPSPCPILLPALVGEAACGVWGACRFEPQPCLHPCPRRPRRPRNSFQQSSPDGVFCWRETLKRIFGEYNGFGFDLRFGEFKVFGFDLVPRIAEVVIF